jgi:uncharacterized protein DUF1302
MRRWVLRVARLGVLAAVLAIVWRAPTAAVLIDKDGDIKLGVRTYANIRVGTQDTTNSNVFDSSIAPGTTPIVQNQTFPISAAGHLRQNRYFLEAELDHNLSRLVKDGVGPLALVNALPFKITDLKYHLTFRGQYDNIYDWGPKEYSTANQYFTINPVTGQRESAFTNPATGSAVNVFQARQDLRDIASVRNQLFQAYVEGNFPFFWRGPLFLRFGRQILSWGETDGFRLLDNINPLDNSFGGFLVDLDERRLPLDMLRLQYFLGDLGLINEAFFEFYGAIDNKVGYAPGIPAGSPWALPNLGSPSATTQTIINTPTRTFSDMRGGGRFAFNVADSTFSIAHYYTYVDNPGLQTFIRPNFPTDPLNPGQAGFPGAPNLIVPNSNATPFYSAQAIESPPKVQVTGGSATFALPALYSVVRSELAYFHDEPRYSQANLDPFIYGYFFNGQECRGEDCRAKRAAAFGSGNNVTGGLRKGDSFNYVLGVDMNQFIRVLNPNESFFISTQFFYRHLFDVVSRAGVPGRFVEDGEVLPVPSQNIYVPNPALRQFGDQEPDFIHEPTDSFLQTLFISTNFFSGKVTPSFTFFYDWGGSFLYQPAVVLTRDPFRFVMDYSIIDAHSLKGGSGVSLLKDRDNLQFRIEYVI